MSQHLFLLCGLPFSVKSTMGRSLAKELGSVHVEVDQHHLDNEGTFPGRRVERAEWIAAYRAAYARVEDALAAGKSVVFDAVSYRRLQRDRIRRIALKHGIPMTILYLDVDPELAKSRMAANRIEQTRPNVPDADFEEVKAGIELPMPDETWIAYRPAEPPESWIWREIVPLVAL